MDEESHPPERPKPLWPRPHQPSVLPGRGPRRYRRPASLFEKEKGSTGGRPTKASGSGSFEARDSDPGARIPGKPARRPTPAGSISSGPSRGTSASSPPPAPVSLKTELDHTDPGEFSTRCSPSWPARLRLPRGGTALFTTVRRHRLPRFAPQRPDATSRHRRPLRPAVSINDHLSSIQHGFFLVAGAAIMILFSCRLIDPRSLKLSLRYSSQEPSTLAPAGRSSASYLQVVSIYDLPLFTYESSCSWLPCPGRVSSMLQGSSGLFFSGLPPDYRSGVLIRLLVQVGWSTSSSWSSCAPSGCRGRIRSRPAGTSVRGCSARTKARHS